MVKNGGKYTQVSSGGKEETKKREICGGGIPPEENIGGKGGIDHFLVYCFRKKRIFKILFQNCSVCTTGTYYAIIHTMADWQISTGFSQWVITLPYIQFLCGYALKQLIVPNGILRKLSLEIPPKFLLPPEESCFFPP